MSWLIIWSSVAKSESTSKVFLPQRLYCFQKNSCSICSIDSIQTSQTYLGKETSCNDSLHFLSDVGFFNQMWRRHHQFFSNSWKECGSYKNSFHLPSSLMKDFFLQFMITCIRARYVKFVCCYSGLVDVYEDWRVRSTWVARIVLYSENNLWYLVFFYIFSFCFVFQFGTFLGNCERERKEHW